LKIPSFFFCGPHSRAGVGCRIAVEVLVLSLFLTKPMDATDLRLEELSYKELQVLTLLFFALLSFSLALSLSLSHRNLPKSME
jgi:hypothetical protein